MEIKITTPQILKILYLLSWLIFIGISIDAGAIIFNAAYWLIAKPTTATYFWERVNFLSLYNYDRGYFFVITLLMTIVAGLKFCMFFLIIKILDKKLDMTQPFTREMGRFLFIITYLVLMTGIFCSIAVKWSDWLITKGVSMPTLQGMQMAGADVWFFMGITLFVVAHIFKRGIELQAENNLTI